MSDQSDTYLVKDLDGETLWEKTVCTAERYSDDPQSIYQTVERPLCRAAQAECIEQAYALGGVPYIRHNAHENWIEVISWDIPVTEDEADNLILQLPIGNFSLKARRARKGDVISEVTVTSFAVGFGRSATEDQDSPPVKIHGRLSPAKWPHEDVHWFQPSHITYADGTRSGYLGAYPRDLTPVEGRR